MKIGFRRGEASDQDDGIGRLESLTDATDGWRSRPGWSQATLAPPASVRFLRPGWPIVLVFWGYGLWWVLGLSNVIWLIVALPMLLILLMAPSVRLPRGLGVWPRSSPSPPLVHADRRVVTRDGVVAALRVLRGISGDPRLHVQPRRQGVPYSTDAQLPRGVLDADGGRRLSRHGPRGPGIHQRGGDGDASGLQSQAFVASMFHPRFGQARDFLGFAVDRPAMPFQYTNNWGSTSR